MVAQLGEKVKFSHHANSAYGIPFDILDLHRKTLQRMKSVSAFFPAVPPPNRPQAPGQQAADEKKSAKDAAIAEQKANWERGPGKWKWPDSSLLVKPLGVSSAVLAVHYLF